MQNLLNFLYRFRTFGFFLVLEGFCAWLIISYNQRQNAAFLNSSNAAIASISSFTHNTANYLNLLQVNKQLLEENEVLRTQLAMSNKRSYAIDTSLRKYDFIAAEVINNTYQRDQNFFTLDGGHNVGIEPGMGVIASKGVVGKVKSVSQNFATVISLLHRGLLISSNLKSSNTLCTVQWDGVSPYEAEVKYIPRHISLFEGDSIVTSGFNSVFPPDILIGTVSSFNLNIEDAFYEAKVKLAVDFTSLNYAFVIKSQLKEEKDSLEFITIEGQ
ncbi:MAG: rod shape-determining protein MreC [Cyclobacteriaceae bacterium]